MSPVTHPDAKKLSDHLSKMAARHMRSVIQGADVKLSEIADKPGMPGVTAISKYQNGADPASWLNRTYLFVLALALSGAPKEEVDKLTAGLRSATNTIYARLSSEDQIELDPILQRASEADVAEELPEMRAWRENLSTPALMGYLPHLEEQETTTRRARLAVERELTERRLA